MPIDVIHLDEDAVDILPAQLAILLAILEAIFPAGNLLLLKEYLASVVSATTAEGYCQGEERSVTFHPVLHIELVQPTR